MTHILCLPQEMNLYILKQMDIRDVFKMREICKYFNKLVKVNIKYMYHFWRNREPDLFEKVTFRPLIPSLDYPKVVEACKTYYKNCVIDLIKQTHHIYPYYQKRIDEYTIPKLKNVYNLLMNKFYLYIAVEAGKLSKNQIEAMIMLKKDGLYDACCYDAVTKTHSMFAHRIIKLRREGICDYYAVKSVILLDFMQIDNMLQLKKVGVSDYYALKASFSLNDRKIKYIIQEKQNGLNDFDAFKKSGFNMVNNFGDREWGDVY